MRTLHSVRHRTDVRSWTPGVILWVISACSLCTAQEAANHPYSRDVREGDSPQWGRTPHRNNAVDQAQLPSGWSIGTGENIKWSVPLGSQTFGSPVIANGKVYVGTNNSSGYVKRFPNTIDLSVLLCFRESNGEFLWQHSSDKLPFRGRGVNDSPMQGIHSSPVVEGDRLWFVTTRGEVVCLDAEGFHDNRDDGPETFGTEKTRFPYEEADVIWSFDMMQKLGVRQYHRATCSPTIWGDVLFICTSNGPNETHTGVAAPLAPSFIAMDKTTGKVLWTDNSPGEKILHGQWSSPAVGELGSLPQVIFGGGDGWLYSFRADRWENGKPELLWKFDANPKDAIFALGGRSRRNGIVSPPAIYGGKVYSAVGADPEYGEGPGHLWCIDPTKLGDVSPEMVVDQNGNPVPQRLQPANGQLGANGWKTIANRNSAAVWHYDQFDQNGNGRVEFEETMHRSFGSPVIKDDMLVITDSSGMVHCLNAKTGEPYWTWDTFDACWTTPLIAGKQIYVADEAGDILIFPLSADPLQALPPREFNLGEAVYTMPVAANDVLFIASRVRLFAIAAEK